MIDICETCNGHSLTGEHTFYNGSEQCDSCDGTELEPCDSCGETAVIDGVCAECDEAKLYYTYFEYCGEIGLTLSDWQCCSASGDATQSVLEVMNEPYIKEQFRKIKTKTMIAELYEYGAWTDQELESRESNIMRLVWIAACDIQQSTNEE